MGGLASNRLFIKYVFAQAFELTEEGWRMLTLALGTFRFAGWLIATRSSGGISRPNIWVDFKVWGIIPLIFLFALAQTPL